MRLLYASNPGSLSIMFRIPHKSEMGSRFVLHLAMTDVDFRRFVVP